MYEKSHEELSQAETRKEAVVTVRKSQWPSTLAEALAGRLAAERKIGSDVHWGNDGFCVDVAIHHPNRPEDVTIGVVCDTTRFGLAEDPVEWEIFRTSILEGQGWRLHRLWSPHFFRDPRGAIEAITAQAAEMVANEEHKDSIRVVDSGESPTT
jgi:hypothetical protein